MEIVEETEKRSGVGDSAYSYSCSNTKSTQSSKSTSESNSSGSSGYRGKRADADYNIKNNTAQPNLEKTVNGETKAVDVKLKSAEAVNNLDAQIIELNATSPSSNKDVNDGIENVYLSTPPVTVGEEGKESDSMDISDISTHQNKDLVFCIKTKDYFQSTVCEPHASSIICTIDYPKTHCSDGFFCVISMVDGVVMYTTLSISSSLGFPQDMWIGRSFTDFIHPNDRETFVSQVSNDCTLWKNVNASHAENHASTMFCRIRRHKLLHSGFGVNHDITPTFKPFCLKFFFKNIIEEDVIYLVIQAMSFSSSFKISYEKIIQPVPFVMKHSANGSLKYIDRESISYLGYLPQDIMDKDMFELYHPADMVYLLQVYESLVKDGSHDRCKAYRMLAQNGNYIKVETEWTSYINPWSRKVEYIIGKHYVVEGPANPNVFDTPEEETAIILSDEDKAKVQQLTNNIKKLLNEVITKPTKLAKHQMTKRCQEIAAFMESFIDKTNAENCTSLRHKRCKSHSIDRLGGLCTDSKSSTETSVSYGRLNYDETLQRYFDSHEPCLINGNASDYLFKMKEFSPEGVASPNANVSPIPSELTTASTSSSPDLTAQNQTVWLTESLLNKHNEKMEKKLVKTHYENKSLNKGDKRKIKDMKAAQQKLNECLERCNGSYQPTAGPHLAHLNSLKRPMDVMACPVPYKKRCTGVGDDGKPIGMVPVFPNAIIAPYVMYGQGLCGVPYTYSPINQLPYTLEQSCMQFINPPGKSSCSNGDSTDTNQYRGDKKVKMSNSEETVYNTDEDLSFSSLYSSFFKTESKSAEDTESKPVNKDDGKFWQRRLLMDDVSSNASCEHLRSQNITRRKMEPPWMEKVTVTSDLIYKYQIFTKSMEEVLSGDRKKLEKLSQPALVNEQLGQLYMDLQLEGVAARLTLEDGITSSGSSSDETTVHCSKNHRSMNRRRRGYDKMAIVYEADAPLPPPEESATSEAT